MVAWKKLQEMIAQRDMAAVASALRGLDDEQRRALAQATHPVATLECVEELAAQRGSSQIIVQARRLRDTLAAARP